MTKKRKNNPDPRFDDAGESIVVAKTQKNIVESHYSVKWKKISSFQTEILVGPVDGVEETSIGFANMGMSSRKWTVDTKLKAPGYIPAGSSKAKEFNTDIEAGRYLKELWWRLEKHKEYQINLASLEKTKKNSNSPGDGRANNNKSGAGSVYRTFPSGGDDSFTDDEWEELMSDFSPDGD